MATRPLSHHGAGGFGGSAAAQESGNGRSYFEMQRAALVGEIGVGLEHVLQNINKLNRAMEGVIAVGNEFSSVEALWSQFESVMGNQPENGEVETEDHDSRAAESQGAESADERGEGERSEDDRDRRR